MNECPICNSTTLTRVENTPYWCCPSCDAWFQNPQPPKVYHGPDEPPISDGDREANVRLAQWLVREGQRLGPLHNAGHACVEPRSLDIGCKEPVLASALSELGLMAAAVDADPGVMTSPGHSGVRRFHMDFERMTESDGHYIRGRDGYNLITMVHVFEHMADPVNAMRSLRFLLSDWGMLFLRLPDHRVPGFERDLTPHHYAIHPFYHCLTSILELCWQTKAFVVEWTEASGPGQRDIILRPV